MALVEAPHTVSNVHLRLEARYDVDSDTLFLEPVEPTRIVSRPGHIPGTYGLYTLDSQTLVGLTILCFYERFVREHPKEAQELMSFVPEIKITPGHAPSRPLGDLLTA